MNFFYEKTANAMAIDGYRFVQTKFYDTFFHLENKAVGRQNNAIEI